ncbi:hypothetical protein DFH11DRAFT_1583410 [Phellopilus nigrolimitatus]|nr:hypothetical protein DFH11DRAFT_1583410 [Phellopilus nigrolimitatus]
MIVRAHNLEIDEEGLSKGPFKTEYIFRHTAKDGRSHLRIDQYRSENPCKICLRDGIWDDPPDLATAARLNVVFCCSGQQLMILEVPAGTAFRAAGHLPVLAGINAAGEREYVASVSPGDPANAQGNGRVRSVWTTVVEGAQSVVYEDEEGAVHTTEHFWVLVLRYDTSAETEARTRAVGGIDVTGQCHWRAGKTTLHLLNKEEADRVYARDRGVLDPEPRE